MATPRLIQALVFLHYAACVAATPLTPPDIPQQPFIRTIYGWGDQIAVVTETPMPGERRFTYALSVVDQTTSRIVPFRRLSCDSIHDVAYDARLGKLLMCGTGNSARVHRLIGASWSPISEPVQGRAFRFAVDGDRIAVVSESTIRLSQSSANGRTASIPNPVKVTPSALLFENDVLLLAFDLGEWGGGLYRIDLKRPDKTPIRMIDGNVQALARAKSGVVWAAGGLSHGLASGSLHRIDGDAVEVVAAIEGFEAGRQAEEILKRSGVPFPGVTSLSGFALGKEDRPTVALTALGVFELSHGRFVALYNGPLSFHYRMPGYEVGSHPVGLVIGKSGEIYVASRSLGIFALRKDNDRYGFKQLIFDDPAPDRPSPTR